MYCPDKLACKLSNTAEMHRMSTESTGPQCTRAGRRGLTSQICLQESAKGFTAMPAESWGVLYLRPILASGVSSSSSVKTGFSVAKTPKPLTGS